MGANAEIIFNYFDRLQRILIFLIFFSEKKNHFKIKN